MPREQSCKKAIHFLNTLFPDNSIRKVLLVNPPDADESLFRRETALRGRYTNYPPYGLAVLATHLRNIGISVKICNLNHAVLKQCHGTAPSTIFNFEKTWQDILTGSISDFKPDIIGIGCMFSMTHISFKKVCEYIKMRFSIPIAIGGVHVSNDLDRILQDIKCADMAFCGEADLAFPRFIEVVNGKKDIKTLGQIVLNIPEGRLKFDNNMRPDQNDIGIIPAYDLLNITEYATYGVIGAFYCFKPQGTVFATVLSNRGCRGNCAFCSVRNFNGKGVRQRSITSVVDEIELLHKKYGVGHIMWLDDDLFFNHQRAISLFHELAKRQLSLTWDATNGVVATSCTDEVIAAAAASGCIALNIGVESGNKTILKSVRKPSGIKDFIEAANVLKNYEQIHASVFLMLGFPDESMSMIMETIDLARTMNLDWYRISQLHPLPNTPIYDALVSQGRIKPVGDKETRFNGGAFGKQAEQEQGLRMASSNFKEAFSSIHDDSIPTPNQLTDIWFFMNYHLNFQRIFHETRPIKIKQLQQHLQTLADVISPENGFALYFLAYLQYKEKHCIDDELITRLHERLNTSPYWRDRMTAFGLSEHDLLNKDFADKEQASSIGFSA